MIDAILIALLVGVPVAVYFANRVEARNGFADLGSRVDALAAHVDALNEPEPEHGFVRIHQIEGMPTLEGVLVAREPQYVLKHAAMIEGEGRTVDLEGVAEVPREHVALVQVLGQLEPPS